MARILISTFGTAGDLNPFVALALELEAIGHDVAFAVEDNFRSTVADAGFSTIYDLSGTIDPTFAFSERRLYRSSLPFRSVHTMITRYLVPTLQEKVESLRLASLEVDLIVAPPEQFAASIVSELTGVPWASVNLSPVSIPSVHVKPHPWPAPLPELFQQLSNRLQWSVARKALRLLADGPINAIRAQYGLPPRRNLLMGGNISPYLAAVAVSPAFMPLQPDWPPGLEVTGFCFWDIPTDWAETAELTAFLDGSQPVVAISSGSISRQVGITFDRFYEVSIEGVRQAGGRALVIGASPESLPNPLPDDVLALPFAPFSQIYPRCAAVIHHGGIGTTAQALRAGVPALVVPWGFDQYFTAAQVMHIAAGLWASRRRYTARRVATALWTLLETNSTYRRRARIIADQIAGEDGAGNLVTAIEELLGRSELATSLPPRRGISRL